MKTYRTILSAACAVLTGTGGHAQNRQTTKGCDINRIPWAKIATLSDKYLAKE